MCTGTRMGSVERQKHFWLFLRVLVFFSLSDAALLLHKLDKEVNEANLSSVVKASGAEVNEAQVKSLVAALADVDINEAVKAAPVAVAAAAPAADAAADAPAKEEKKEEPKNEEAAMEGLSSLFG